MDARIPPLLDALLASAEEMKQHAEWVEIVLARVQFQFTSGEYTANLAIAQGIRNHAEMHYRRIERIEREWLERGDHSKLCDPMRWGPGGVSGIARGCTGWCRANEPLPVVVPVVVPVVAPKAPQLPKTEDESAKQDRFSLIELE